MLSKTCSTCRRKEKKTFLYASRPISARITYKYNVMMSFFNLTSSAPCSSQRQPFNPRSPFPDIRHTAHHRWKNNQAHPFFFFNHAMVSTPVCTFIPTRASSTKLSHVLTCSRYSSHSRTLSRRYASTGSPPPSSCCPCPRDGQQFGSQPSRHASAASS